MFETVHKFVQRKVEQPREDLPSISIRDALTAFTAVVLAEVAVFLCLYFFFVPSPVAQITSYTVTAAQALAGMDSCDIWKDETQYPVDGLALPRMSRTIDVRLFGPVTNETIMNILPNLTCVGPTNQAAEDLGINIMLGIDVYGWQGYSGQVDSLCTHPSEPTLVVRNLATAWDQSCYAAFGRAKTHYDALLRAYPNVTDPPALMGLECSISMSTPVRGQFRYFFHWPRQPTRWGITGWMMFFCDGLTGVQQDFLVNNKRNMTDAELAALNTTAGLCGRSFNGSCLRSYRRQKWGKSAEYIRVEPARLQCTVILNAYSGRSDPSWAPGCSRSVNGQQIYFQDPSPGYFTPPNGTSFEGDPSLAIKMLEELSAIPEGQSPSMQNMPSSCPGRTSNVWDIIGPSITSYREVQLLLQTYGQLPLFTYSCTRLPPPSFQERVSYIFPYLNIAHAIAMTYLIRYLYVGLRATNKFLGEKLRGADASQAVDHPEGEATGKADPLREFEQVLDVISRQSRPSPRATPTRGQRPDTLPSEPARVSLAASAPLDRSVEV